MTHYRKASCDVVPITDHNAILEAAARALEECGFYDNEAIAAAKTMLTVATPLIRADALEEAAVAAEEWAYAGSLTNIATAIRALKEQP